MDEIYERASPEEIRRKRRKKQVMDAAKKRGAVEDKKQTIRKASNADKLKNEKRAAKSMREKFLDTKAETALSPHAKRKRRIKRLNRKMSYSIAAAKKAAEEAKTAGTDDSADYGGINTDVALGATGAGTEAVVKIVKNATGYDHVAKNEENATDSSHKERDGPGSKLHRWQRLNKPDPLTDEEEDVSNPISRFYQRNLMKKEIELRAAKESEKNTSNGIGSIGKKFVDKAEDMAGKVAEFVAENYEAIAYGLLILIVVLIIGAAVGSCSMMAGGVQDVTIQTSFTAQDEQIVAVNDDYLLMEKKLRYDINHFEATHPGYDEYRYILDEIGHNPYELAAILTVLYEDYTREEVQEKIKEIFEKQYILRTEVVEETRHKEVDGEDVEYTYRILKVYLSNNGIDRVVRAMGLSEDELERYELLLATYGNKGYLFEDDIYAHETEGDDYHVPSEVMTDEKVANLIREAQRYLNTPYVWGGYSPVGFDCSGYVSYVINHCGNGWNIGRKTAKGLLAKCERISKDEAKPGDLIFFQGTYDTAGASHVGIYLGNGMMIHCGNPVQYSSVNTNYWRNHFLTYGRLDL